MYLSLNDSNENESFLIYCREKEVEILKVNFFNVSFFDDLECPL